MNGRQIVPLEEKWFEQMAQIEILCFSDPWSLQALAGELESPLARYFLCVEGEKLLGYAGARMVLEECQVVNVAARPDCRRQGVASQAMEALLACARREGREYATLEVRRSNVAALRLYQKLGFAPQGIRPGYYEKPREDALLMMCKFAPDAGAWK